MLFPQKKHSIQTVKYVVVNRNVPKNLSLLCHNANGHILPVAMRFKKISFTNSGIPTAEYVCDLCKKRQGWIYDAATRKPKMLWHRK